VDGAIHDVLESCAFAGGPFVAEFEKSFAAYCRSTCAIGVGSGTEALWMALIALGVGPGDEVITVPNSFLATAEAISLAGAKPIFVDVRPDTYTLDPSLIDGAVNTRTKAIIPVHLFGQTADMDPIMKAAKKHSLFVIEDACQAHGAEYRGRRAGSIGDVGCFSFYPGKNLGAYGEAGAVVTNSPSIDEKVRMFRDHGQRKKYYHDIVGFNGRMDGLQGAILNVKLKHLDEWNDARRRVALRYRSLLEDVEGLHLPVEASYGTHVYHIFAARSPRRDQMIEELRAKGVHCGIHYPVPIHLQKAYGSLGLGEGSFPVSEKCAAEFISLPMFAELSEEQSLYVAKSLRELSL
jgi:dTDP-4-amino-4,6-dideoxygalactose transaminase